MVQDATFFQSELRQKLNLIVEEIRRLNTELDVTTKENSNYNTFEKKADALAAELRDLQNTLGDLNTLVDKLHTGTDLEEFERECQQFQTKNQRTTQTLDEIFLQRQQKESAIKEAEKEIQEEKAIAEKQIEELDPARQQTYAQLKQENETFLTAIIAKQNDLEQIQSKAIQLENEISRDPMKEKAVQYFKRLIEATDKQRELELELKTAGNESVAQERNRLLEQVKNDNLETSGMERRIAEMEQQIRSFKEQLNQNTSELDASQGFFQLISRKASQVSGTFEKRCGNATVPGCI